MGHVPHLLIAGPWVEPTLPVPRETYRHLTRVLRLGVGEPVSYTDGAGSLGSGSWSGELVVRGPESVVDRPVPPLVVACAVPKARERQRFLVEKLAELGVARLQWIRTTYSEGRPPGVDKQTAWAAAALAQSRSAFLMDIEGPLEWDALAPPVVVADPDGVDLSALSPALHTLAIGPEGGWAPNEIDDAALRLRLGPTILRTETAAVVGAAALLRHLHHGA